MDQTQSSAASRSKRVLFVYPSREYLTPEGLLSSSSRTREFLEIKVALTIARTTHKILQRLIFSSYQDNDSEDENDKPNHRETGAKAKLREKNNADNVTSMSRAERGKKETQTIAVPRSEYLHLTPLTAAKHRQVTLWLHGMGIPVILTNRAQENDGDSFLKKDPGSTYYQ